MTAFLEGRQWLTCRLPLLTQQPSFMFWLKEGQLIDTSIRNGLWEPPSSYAVERIVKPGMVCLDVGANIGYYTVLCAHLAGPAGHVHAFETMDEPRRVIEEHIRANHIKNATVHPCGLGSTNADADLFTNYSWPPEVSGPQIKEHIAIRRIDDLKLGRVDFIKLDVDGPELDVLFGALVTLRKYKPSLLLEVCDYTLRSFAGRSGDPSYIYGSKTAEMLNMLRGLGYQFFDEVGWTPVESTEQLLRDYDLSRRSVNLVCTHKGAEGAIIMDLPDHIEYEIWNNLDATTFLQDDKDNPARAAAAKVVRDAAKRMHKKPTLIELGCGTGIDYLDHFAALENEGILRYMAMDGSKNFVDHCRKFCPRVKVGTFDTLEADGKQYDFTYVKAVLEHQPGVEKPLRQLLRSTKVMCVVSWYLVPNEEPESIRYSEAERVFYNRYNRDHVRSIIKSESFSVEWIPLANKQELYILKRNK
jgi:FkbM family methyltransferase